MRVFLLIILLCTSLSLMAQHQHERIPYQPSETQADQIPSVTHYVTQTFDNVQLRTQVNRRGGANMTMDLGAYGQYNLELVNYDMFGPGYFAQDQDGNHLRSSTAQTLKGYSSDGGEVRLTLAEHFTYGFIEQGGETYWIEPAWYYHEEQDPNDIVIYKESDVHVAGVRTCGVTETRQKSNQLQDEIRRQSANRVGQCYQVELAVASDHSMYVKYGSSTANVENHNIAVINNVNGNYSGEFDDDIILTIVTQFFSTCSTCDPWTSSTDATVLLPSFGMWAFQGGFGMDHDLGELWTNRDFDGPTVGIAYVGVVCDNARYHCLQDFTANASLLRTDAAHEIGHNFNSFHDTPANFIMSEFLSNTNTWSTNSLNVISSYISVIASQGGCFSDCPAGDAPIPAYEALATNICPGTTIKFFDRSTNLPTTWSWTFPGGTPATSSDQYPSVTYDITGTFPVILEVSNGAGSNSQTFSGAIAVGDPGQSFPLYQDFDDGFAGWTVENPDNSVAWEVVAPTRAPGGTAAAVINNFAYPALGQRDALVSPVFSLAGYQSAMLHVEYAHAALASGPRDSLIIYVSGDDGQSFQRFYAAAENGSGNFATRTPLASSFNPQTLDEWCGSGGFGATCLDLDISNYLGSRDVIIRIENYTNSGNNTYVDRVYVTSDCFNLPPPIAAFSASPQSGCLPLIVQFQDQSQNSPIEWLWTFQDGSPATSNEQNPEVIFTSPGVFAVSLSVTNESGTDVHVENSFITVIGDPVAAFSSSVSAATVTFNNLSIDATDYVWNFGDGATSGDENPMHTYASDGTYQVTLQAFNDCGSDDITIDIQIGTPPAASYEASPIAGCAPMQVQFVSTSSANTTDLQWFFEGGSPETSTVLDPLVTYSEAGNFDVTLIAINGSGTDTLFEMNKIIVGELPTAAFSYEVDDLTVSFTNLSSAATDYDWAFGDGNHSMETDPEHIYSDENSYTVTLIAINDCGSDTTLQTIGLGGFPSSLFTSDQSSGCLPLMVQFDAADAGVNDNVAWTFEGGDPATSLNKNETVTYSAPGSYDVQCIVSNSLGSDTTNLPDFIEVQGSPEADFEMLTDGFLTGFFTYDGTPFDNIFWDFGDSSTSDETNPTHIFDDIGIWRVTCIASNMCGVDTFSLDFDQTASLLEVGLPSESQCIGSLVRYTVDGLTSSPAFMWTFEGGDPATSTSSAPLIRYDQSGTYDVSLTASLNGAELTRIYENTVVIEDEPIADFTADLRQLTNTSQNSSNFQWFVDGTFVSDETDYALTANGDYEVMLIASNSCGSDSLIQNLTISATNTIPSRNQGMTIFPNPNHGSFALSFDRPVTQVDLEIFNSRGQKIIQSHQWNQLLNITTELSQGLYLIKATTSNGIFIGKVVVVE